MRIRRLAEAQINKLGFDVETASDGFQAVRLVQENPLQYSVVLMDCQMPKMDGFEATRSIRDFEENQSSHMVIIAMTANALSGHRERCIQAGMDGYISKPISLSQLAEVLAQWEVVSSVFDDLGSSELLEEVLDGPILEPRTIASIRKLHIPGEADFLSELIDMYLIDLEI